MRGRERKSKSEIKRERERGRERETSMCERNLDWLPPSYAPPRDRTHNPGMFPDWELNPQPFDVWDNSHSGCHLYQFCKTLDFCDSTEEPRDPQVLVSMPLWNPLPH